MPALFLSTVMDKSLRQTLVFMWNSALRKKFNFYFSQFLIILTKFSFWEGGCALGYSSMKSYVVGQLVRQLLYNTFITNNRASFRLWWKENSEKHQKVSKYYDHDCKLEYVKSQNHVFTTYPYRVYATTNPDIWLINKSCNLIGPQGLFGYTVN